MPDSVLFTGGAGYIGAPLRQEPLSFGRGVTALDALVHGQERVATELE